jgi:hypothetical protein
MTETQQRYARNLKIIDWLIYGMIIVLMVFTAKLAFAVDNTEVVTFQWDQEDKTNLEAWEMHWSDTPGGLYSLIANIPYAGEGILTFESPVSATVSGTPGDTVTKYFVLRACGTPAGEPYKCSTWSNEVSYVFQIPVYTFQVPVQFRIVPTP